jgi:hypothetical protein
MAIMGDMSLGGTMVQVRNLAESLQVAFDAGAKKILLPMSSVTDIPTVPGELFAKFQTSFYSDPVDAVFQGDWGGVARYLASTPRIRSTKVKGVVPSRMPNSRRMNSSMSKDAGLIACSPIAGPESMRCTAKKAGVLVVLDRADQVDDLLHHDQTEGMHRVGLGLLARRDRPVGDLQLSLVEQAVVDRGLDVGVDRRRHLVERVRDDAQLVSPPRDSVDACELATPCAASNQGAMWLRVDLGSRFCMYCSTKVEGQRRMRVHARYLEADQRLAPTPPLRLGTRRSPAERSSPAC